MGTACFVILHYNTIEDTRRCVASVKGLDGQEESFSLVTVEVMSCGTPVIVLGTSAVRELVEEGCGVVLDENRIEGYRKAIERIEADEPDRRKIAEHGSRYKRQSMADKILRLYEGLQ